MRLLLVHGTLADYRLGRLIKYSFYKNITFAFIFLFFQPFNGVSGQVEHLGSPLLSLPHHKTRHASLSEDLSCVAARESWCHPAADSAVLMICWRRTG